jgi:hypothetical protein
MPASTFPNPGAVIASIATTGSMPSSVPRQSRIALVAPFALPVLQAKHDEWGPGMERLSGKTVLVTGSTDGVDRLVALEQLLLPRASPDLDVAGAALRAERPEARELVATLRSRRYGKAAERAHQVKPIGTGLTLPREEVDELVAVGEAMIRRDGGAIAGFLEPGPQAAVMARRR